MMLGIAFGDYKIDQLKVYGATGGRLDHAAINAFGILNPDLRKYANQLTLIDKQNLIFFTGKLAATRLSSRTIATLG